VLSENSGQYVCDAINGFGGERIEVTIYVMSAPKVIILSEHSSLVENSLGILECIVENKHDKECNFSWIVDGKIEDDVSITFFSSSIKNYRKLLNSLQKNSSTYEFIANRIHHKKSIACRVACGDFLISNDIVILVNYPPKFSDREENKILNIKVLHGKDFELSCVTDENPKSNINWSFTPKDSRETMNLNHYEKIFKVQGMNDQKQGNYECLVENSLGRVKRSFNVIDYPKGRLSF
jgi:Immunoglobulin I-set domain